MEPTAGVELLHDPSTNLHSRSHTSQFVSFLKRDVPFRSCIDRIMSAYRKIKTKKSLLGFGAKGLLITGPGSFKDRRADVAGPFSI